MPRRRRRTGSEATAFKESPETTSSDAATMMPETGTVRESAKAAASVSPTESEIAAVAHQLWLDKGCPAGSDQEDWFQAETMFKNALVGKCENLSRPPSIPHSETCREPDILAEFRWEGHWEVWESEWAGARWTTLPLACHPGG